MPLKCKVFFILPSLLEECGPPPPEEPFPKGQCVAFRHAMPLSRLGIHTPKPQARYAEGARPSTSRGAGACGKSTELCKLPVGKRRVAA